METSSTIGELAKALAAAQGMITGATKDSENLAFKRGNKVSTYADLASTWEACRRALSVNGLCVIQSAETDDAGVRVTTTLAHSSGEWVRSTLSIPCGDTAHAIGSGITYARRFALAAAVGVAPIDDDDDGNGATSSRPGSSHGPGKLADAPNLKADAAEAAAERMRVLAAIKEAAEACPEVPRPESGKLPAPGKLGAEAKRHEDVLFVEDMKPGELNWHEEDLQKQIARPDSMGKRDALSATLAAIQEQKAWRLALKRAFDAKRKDEK